MNCAFRQAEKMEKVKFRRHGANSFGKEHCHECESEDSKNTSNEQAAIQRQLCLFAWIMILKRKLGCMCFEVIGQEKSFGDLFCGAKFVTKILLWDSSAV